MISLRDAALVLLGGLAACGEPVAPCTDCAAVAGSYLAEAEEVAAASSTCGELFFEPLSLEITVEQEQAALTTTGFFGVTGTLHDDLGVTFAPVTVLAGGNTQLQLQLIGSFAGEEGKRTLSGRMDFASADGCGLQVPITWTQLEK